MAGGRAGLRRCGDAGLSPHPHLSRSLLLTLLGHIQGLHGWLHRERPLVARAPGCVLKAGMVSILGRCSHKDPARVPFPALVSLLLWGLPGASTGREHALHQPLHGEEVDDVGVNVSAQLPQILTLQQGSMNARPQQGAGLGERWWDGYPPGAGGRRGSVQAAHHAQPGPQPARSSQSLGATPGAARPARLAGPAPSRRPPWPPPPAAGPP